MSFEAGNVLMGPCTVYFGLQGINTVEPLSGAINDTPPASAWEPMGGTLGGVSTSLTPTFTDLRMDQIPEDIDAQMTRRQLQVSMSLAEITLKNISRAAGGVYSGTPATGENFKLTSGPSAFKQPATKLLLDGFAPDPSFAERRRRLVLRKVKNTGETTIMQAPDQQQVLAYVFRAFYVNATTSPLEYWDAPLAA